MESITIGQIGAAFALVMTIGGGIVALVKWIRSVIVKVIQTELAPIKADVASVDLENCKNYLVTYLASVERGEEKEEIEKERFWEQYGHYTAKGGNSYIKNRVAKLQADNLL